MLNVKPLMPPSHPTDSLDVGASDSVRSMSTIGEDSGKDLLEKGYVEKRAKDKKKKRSAKEIVKRVLNII